MRDDQHATLLVIILAAQTGQLYDGGANPAKLFILVTFFKKWAIPGLFFVYFRSYSNKHQYNFTRNEREIMSIQYTAFGFEPTTFRT